MIAINFRYEDDDEFILSLWDMCFMGLDSGYEPVLSKVNVISLCNYSMSTD